MTSRFPVSKDTSALWWFVLVYVALIAYASLFPFTGWRSQGVPFWAFLQAPWPKYWTGFDLIVNAVGYMPLGFLLYSGIRPRRKTLWAWLLATLLAAMLSFGMEALQTFLPRRIASNLDLGLNALGAGGGGLVAIVLWHLASRLGVLALWVRIKQRYLAANSQFALALLALWPLALLFPLALPLGLGQVVTRLGGLLTVLLQDTPYASWQPSFLTWDALLLPLTPLAEAVCVALGFWVPVLLGYSVLRHIGLRLSLVVLLLLVSLGATGLSAALSYGPHYAWDWLQLPVRTGLGVAVLLALALVWLPRRVCWLLLLLAVMGHLSVLNQAPINPYFAHTLGEWEQGRFMRFHGLAQWLGWLWPFAVLAQAVRALLQRPHPYAQAEA